MHSSFRTLAIFLFIKSLPETVFIILAVAFYTLVERRILASTQRRRGPSVVGPYGVGQPIADGLKLLAKEWVIAFSTNAMIFIIAPLVSFFFALYS